jgi:hypothetical protein
MRSLLILTCYAITVVNAFIPLQRQTRRPAFLQMAEDIVSPFDDNSEGSSSSTATMPGTDDSGPLDLTWDNVELVLDGMRSFLISDGGNVVITEIDGPIVRLELVVSGGMEWSTPSIGIIMVYERTWNSAN